MFSGRGALMATLSTEVSEHAAHVIKSTATVTGQTKDFSTSAGSAWIYDTHHLVTNNHVVDDLVEPIWVRLHDQREIQTLVVGRDPLTDLAVLQMPEAYGEPLQVREETPRLGELCFAFGSPLGTYRDSMSFGIVSGLHRSWRITADRLTYDVIQTDCAINHGNSGGPLVSVDGSVIGMSFAGASDSQGIGFAIPADTITNIIWKLLAYGGIERASLGLGVAARHVQEDTTPSRERLVVTAVRKTSADPFELGDVLMSIAGQPVHGHKDLLRVLRRDMVNQKVSVGIMRDGRGLAIECVPRSASIT